MAVRITADSTCDLSPQLIEKYHVGIVPLYVNLGSDSFRDGVTIQPDQLYEYFERTGNLAKTSAASVADYTEAFKMLREGGDEVVHFNLSSEMSASHQNACLAAQEVGGVHVVDSRNLSTGTGLLVLRGAQMAEQGAGAEQICEAMCQDAQKVEASFVIDTMTYLYKGGRCSALAKVGATMLKIKPCIEVKDGVMGVGAKYRGNLRACLRHYVRDRLTDRDDISTERIFITHSGVDDETIGEVRSLIDELIHFDEVLVTRAGCTISSHCGPGTLGILFVRK